MPPGGATCMARRSVSETSACKNYPRGKTLPVGAARVHAVRGARWRGSLARFLDYGDMRTSLLIAALVLGMTFTSGITFAQPSGPNRLGNGPTDTLAPGNPSVPDRLGNTRPPGEPPVGAPGNPPVNAPGAMPGGAVGNAPAGAPGAPPIGAPGNAPVGAPGAPGAVGGAPGAMGGAGGGAPGGAAAGGGR